MSGNELTLRPGAAARALAVPAVLLVAAGAGVQLLKYLAGHDHVFGLFKLFNLDAERNLPTLFAVFILLCATLLLTVIAALERRQGRPDALRWALLAAIFLYLAIDEGWVLHEKLNVPVRGRFEGTRFGVLYYVWVVPASIAVLLLGLYYLGFLRRLPGATRRGFMLAATLFLAGAIGVELFEGRFHEAYGTERLAYHLFVVVEESLELAGVIVLIHALLGYLASHHPELRLRFGAATLRG